MGPQGQSILSVVLNETMKPVELKTVHKQEGFLANSFSVVEEAHSCALAIFFHSAGDAGFVTVSGAVNDSQYDQVQFSG